MAKNKSEILQGKLDLMVLKTLAAMGPLHGNGLARRIEPVSEQTLEINHARIYASLFRLQQRGWISAVWDSSENDRSAKFYCITKIGHEPLSAEAASGSRSPE